MREVWCRFRGVVCSVVLVFGITGSARAEVSELPALLNCSSRSPLPLFQRDEILNVDLAADFPFEELQVGPGSVSYRDADGKEERISVTVAARGHLQAGPKGCEHVPLRIHFGRDTKKERKRTAFAKIDDDLKIIVHCYGARKPMEKNGYEMQKVLQQYTIYRALEAAGFPSLKTRLAKISYYDSKGKPLTQGYAVFLEPKGDAAARCGAKHYPMKSREQIARIAKLYREMDEGTEASFQLAERLAKNWDFIPQVSHNAVLLKIDEKPAGWIPFDFNLSVLVDGHQGWAAEYPWVALNVGNETWLKGLWKNGPYIRSIQYSKEKYGVDSRRPPRTEATKRLWRAALAREARRVLANEERVYRALEQSPVENKKRFKSHFDGYFNALREIVQ